MKYEFLKEDFNGTKIYARIDEDGLCRFTCTEDNSDYQAYLNKDKANDEAETI
jgi:hypothetical protein